MDVHSQKQRSYNMSRIRGRDTKPEVLLRSLLHRSGYRFRLHVKELPGKPDVVLKKYRTVLFVNGCFWHRHQGCRFAATPAKRVRFWQEKFEKTVERDQSQKNDLEALGWQVLTIWECALKSHPDQVLREVKAVLLEN